METKNKKSEVPAAAGKVPEPENKKDPEQTAISTKPPENKKREPRAKGDVAHDFRMASFFGTIIKVVESWNKGRTLSITVETEDHNRATQGLERFRGTDEILFRLVPRQPLIGDKDPEDFSLKVPRFCVEMVMRLEKKAAEGFSGWEKMSLVHHASEMLELNQQLYTEIKEKLFDKKIDVAKIQKHAVDLANYAFFIWALAEVAGKGKPAKI